MLCLNAKMISLIVLLMFFEAVSSAVTQSPISPCPQIFRYETDGYRWYGIIDAPNPPPYGSEMTLKIRMALRTRLLSNYVGKIELADDRETVLRKIAQNWPITYRVYFPLISPIPTVMTIVFSGRRLCTGEPLYGRFITALDLEHTLHSGVSALKNSPRDKLVFGGPVPTQISKPAKLPETTQEKPSESMDTRIFDNEPSESIINRHDNSAINYPSDFIYEPNVKTNNNDNFDHDDICGTTKNINPLIVHGDYTAQGDFPWMVAIFSKKPRGLEFICAGSLVSNDRVVTAGHCVKKINSNSVTKPDSLVLKIGVYNINDWTEETAVTKSVSSIKLHDKYNHGSLLNNDIAVLTLNQPVTYTDYIRPICLWSGDADLDKIVGKTATVAGWGRDEYGLPSTAEPKVTTVPIVSTTTCKASRHEFFQLTSETTLCAGGRNGSGPCNGDSGGGLYMRQGDRWVLRGIVSKSLRDPETFNCDLSEYIVYTDAAKFVDFIR